MDLKALLNKLDKINEHQILMESATIVEEILSAELQLLKESYIALMERVRGKELEALRTVKDEEQRKTQIAALASKNGYPGMFDPVTGKWVDNQGNFAWFGPYKAEVEQMEKDGLVPPEAHTSAFWGVMGKDKDDAFKASTANKSRYDLIDGSDDILDKANQSKKPDAASESVSKGSIAKALTEGFGYSFKYLAEAISEQEHSTLKANIEKLNSPQYKDDKEAQAVIFKYQEYVKYRDQLIAKIKDALSKVMALKPKTPATTLHESRSMLKEEIYLVPHGDNTVSVVHFYLNENGDVVEYIVTEDIEALGRGLLAGATFGWGDNAVARMISMYKGTEYGDELMKQLKASDAAKARSPYWYMGGNLVGGSMVIPGGGGLVAGLAKGAISYGAQVASDKYLRDPHNAKYQQQAAQKDAEKTNNPAIQKIQQTVKAPPSGTMDSATVNAVKDKGAQVSGETSGVEQELFTAFGVKDITGLQAKLKQMGATGYDQIGQAVANALKIAPAPATASESIIYSSMSESERMAYLRNRLTQLDETKQLDEGMSWKDVGLTLEKLSGGLFKTAETKAIQALEALYGGANAKVFLSGGEKFVPQLGSPGKWVDVTGKKIGSLSTDEVLKLAQAEVAAGKIIPAAQNGTAIIKAKPNLPKPVAVADNAVETLNGIKYIKNNGAWKATKGTNQHGQPVFDKAPVDPKIAKQLEKNAQAKPQPQANTNSAPNTTPNPTPAPNANVPPVSPAAATTMSQKLAAQYPKIAAVVGKAGSVLKYGWSKKWWLAMAAIIGYAYTNTNTDPVDPNNPNNPNNPNKPDPNIDQKVDPNAIDPEKLAEIQKYSLNINNWLDQLKAMYPADKETKDLQAEVAEVMKGLPKPTETTKVDQKADNKQPPTDSIVGKYRNDASNINLTGNNPPPAPSTPNGPSVSN